jgi:hypothetical protein
MISNIFENNGENKKSKKNKLKILLFIVLIGIIGFSLTLYFKKESINNEVYNNGDMQKIFTISEYDSINENFKNSILNLFTQNGFLENGSQFFTKIPSRAKKVIAYGNFSNKKDYNGPDAAYVANCINVDIAFVLEKNDFKSSVLYIIAENGDLLYYKEFEDELPTISSFKKGAKIFINERVLEKSPTDGILIFSKYSKNALLFNPKENIFEMYYQYTKEDLENQESEMEEDYKGENDSIANKSSQGAVFNDTVNKNN